MLPLGKSKFEYSPPAAAPVMPSIKPSKTKPAVVRLILSSALALSIAASTAD